MEKQKGIIKNFQNYIDFYENYFNKKFNFKWTTIQVNKNILSPDKNNVGPCLV